MNWAHRQKDLFEIFVRGREENFFLGRMKPQTKRFHETKEILVSLWLKQRKTFFFLILPTRHNNDISIQSSVLSKRLMFN